MDSKETPFRLNSLFMTLLVSAAYWPVFIWLAQRTADRSDEPWGLVALVTAIVLLMAGPERVASLVRNPAGIGADVGGTATGASLDQTNAVNGTPVAARRECEIPDTGTGNSVVGAESLNVTTQKLAKLNFAIGVACLATYLATVSIAPNLVQAVLFVLSMWFLLLHRLPSTSMAGMLGLLLLSLPLVPSLNFYAGYPIRVLVAYGSCFMLNLTGIMANVEGAMLSVKGKLVAIDAPCSGISMLWAEAYVVMLIACLFRLSAKNTLLLTLVGGALIVFGNILRATTLVLFGVLTEAGPYQRFSTMEPTVHVGAGLLVFCLMTGLTFLTGMNLGTKQSARLQAKNDFEDETFSFGPANTVWLWSKKSFYLFAALCTSCALMPVASRGLSLDANNKHAESRTSADTETKWPTIINGKKLTALSASAQESSFARAFPGYMKQFTDGERFYLVRSVRNITRQLHPSSDCFRGSGYQIEPRPIVVAEDGTTWGAFYASNTDANYLVLERIYDQHGVSTTDVSQWYWMACLGKTRGPWFDVTIAQRIAPETTALK